MIKKVLFCLLLIGAQFCLVFAQSDSVDIGQHFTAPDSLHPGLTIVEKAKTLDTITPKLLRPQDSLLNLRILDSLTHGFRLENFDLNNFLQWRPMVFENITFQKGNVIERKNVWLLVIVGLLLITFAILKNAFSKELKAFILSFFYNRDLANLNKEESAGFSWASLFLFIQFGFTLGMFCYLAIDYLDIFHTNDGLEMFFFFSILITALYLLKLGVLRLVGFIFNLQKPFAEYVTILCLSCFNASLLFIPIVVSFCLSPIKYGDFYLVLGAGLLLIIFLIQFIRALFNILSQHRFSKVYLFLYFCTLEISPILILIKVMGI